VLPSTIYAYPQHSWPRWARTIIEEIAGIRTALAARKVKGRVVTGDPDFRKTGDVILLCK